MHDIITIGSATRDVFLRSHAWETHASDHSPTGFEQCLPLGAKLPVDDITFTTGGGATNAAVTFHRLGGLRTACVARIGMEDSGARAVLEDLRRERVDTRFVQRDPKHHTAYSLILLSGSGERTILVHRGASEMLDARAIPWQRLRVRWFSVTSLGGNLALLKKILAHARRIGARVAWNPGGAEVAEGWRVIAPLARRCAVLNVNREEAAVLTGVPITNLRRMIQMLRPDGSDCTTLITDGAGGAYVSDAHTDWHIASRNLHVVNTTGAGDAFSSAFILGILRGMEPPDALRLAMANAEGVITHMGAKTGILSKVPSRAVLAEYRVRAI